MDFGILLLPRPDRCAEQARMAEACGFTHVWVADTHMMSGDVYVSLGLIAQNTTQIKLGTGVAVAGTRPAPVTAHSIATINRLAPGRVILGIGTGNSSRRAMGFGAVTVQELRDHVRVVRALLRDEAVDYREGDVTRTIRFFHQDHDFVNTKDPVPIYVAANAPRALALAGELGDGVITSRTNTPAGWSALWDPVCSGARRANREPAGLYTMVLTGACLLRPGENLSSARVRAEAGPWAAVALHSLYETAATPAAVPESLRAVFAGYKAFLDERYRGDDRYYLELHDGHGLYVRPEEERFLTPAVIEATTMAATPGTLLARLRALEAAGVKQVAFIPTPGSFSEFVREFGVRVIAKY